MANTLRTFDGNFYVGKQSGKGSAASVFHSFRRVDGRISINKELDSVNYVDGSAWAADDFDFVKKISGAGSITLQATPANAGRLMAWALGGTDTVTGSSAPYTHTIVAGSGLTYLTVRDGVGTIGGVTDARQWTDCVITQVELTSTSDAGVVTIKIDLLAITANDSGGSAAPAPDTVDGEPLLHTQAVGNIKLAGLNSGAGVPEIEQFSLTLDTNIELLYGDNLTAYIAHRKRGQISWSCSAAVTDTTIQLLNQHLYGTSSPSFGASPSTTVLTGVFNPKFVQSANSELSINIPKSKIAIDTGSIDPNATGDKATVAIAGVARTPSSGALITVAAKTADSAAY